MFAWVAVRRQESVISPRAILALVAHMHPRVSNYATVSTVASVATHVPSSTPAYSSTVIKTLLLKFSQ